MMKKLAIAAILLLLLTIALVSCADTTEPAPTPTPEPKELSNDIFSLMFSLNDVVYALPFPFAELEANGWD